MLESPCVLRPLFKALKVLENQSKPGTVHENRSGALNKSVLIVSVPFCHNTISKSLSKTYDCLTHPCCLSHLGVSSPIQAKCVFSVWFVLVVIFRSSYTNNIK